MYELLDHEPNFYKTYLICKGPVHSLECIEDLGLLVHDFKDFSDSTFAKLTVILVVDCPLICQIGI